uniref:uncharacterized protein isoform X2 n=1 Tax=Pristiophorus japonicus TaxID=55135 RepID=UPI00398EC4FC
MAGGHQVQDDNTKTASNLVYSVVTIRNSGDGASGPEVLVIYPSNRDVKEGDKLKLQSVYRGRINYFYWRNDSNYINGARNEFYETLVDSSSGGSHQCAVWSGYKWQRSATLKIFTIASDLSLTLEVKPRAALSGESITLECLVPDQKGTGSFLWYRNEKFIQQTYRAQYIITKVEITDEASYRCELRRSYRKWVSPEVNITVTGWSLPFLLSCEFSGWQVAEIWKLFEEHFCQDNSVEIGNISNY